MDKLGFALLTVVNLGGLAACVWLQMQCATLGRRWWLRTGVGLFAVGMIAQLLRNVVFLYTGDSPQDADAPLWALKDVGGAMVAGWFAYMLILQPATLGRLLSSLVGHQVQVVTPPPAPKPAKDTKKPTAKTGARAKSTGSTPPATAGTPRRRTT